MFVRNSRAKMAPWKQSLNLDLKIKMREKKKKDWRFFINY